MIQERVKKIIQKKIKKKIKKKNKKRVKKTIYIIKQIKLIIQNKRRIKK